METPRTATRLRARCRCISLLAGAAAALLSAAPGSAEGEDYTRSGFYVGAGGSLGFALSDTDDYFHDTTLDLFESLEFRNRAFSDAGVDEDLNDSIGVNGRIGYRLNPYFSAEAQLEYLDRFTEKSVSLEAPLSALEAFGFEVDEPADIGSAKQIKTTTVTANARAHLPLGVVQPFVMVGAGVTRTKSKVRIDFVAEDADFNNLPPSNPDANPREPSVLFSVSDSERFRGFAMRFGGGLDVYATEHFALSLGFDYVLPFGEAEPFDYTSFTWGLLYRF